MGSGFGVAIRGRDLVGNRDLWLGLGVGSRGRDMGLGVRSWLRVRIWVRVRILRAKFGVGFLVSGFWCRDLGVGIWGRDL